MTDQGGQPGCAQHFSIRVSRLREADDGRVVFSLPVHSNLLQELGTVFGGVIALLAKSASGAAVQSIAPRLR